MPFISKRPKLKLSKQQKGQLEAVAGSTELPKKKVDRAVMLLDYTEGYSISSIARKLLANRPKVERCIDKALRYGPLPALEDLPGKGRPSMIDPEAKAWIIRIYSLCPKDLGLAKEAWTLTELAEYARDNCKRFGHNCLEKVSRSTIYRILSNTK